MPNHIINTIRLTGDREKISELLESVKDNRFGIGSLDFNKVIPMPESLQIETSSSMERGLKAYKEFVDICTFDGTNKDMDLLILSRNESVAKSVGLILYAEVIKTRLYGPATTMNETKITATQKDTVKKISIKHICGCSTNCTVTGRPFCGKH